MAFEELSVKVDLTAESKYLKHQLSCKIMSTLCFLTYVVPPSCDHMQRLGIERSGFYKVDPDGFAIGSPPITVYCNFTTGGFPTSYSF